MVISRSGENGVARVQIERRWLYFYKVLHANIFRKYSARRLKIFITIVFRSTHTLHLRCSGRIIMLYNEGRPGQWIQNHGCLKFNHRKLSRWGSLLSWTMHVRILWEGVFSLSLSPYEYSILVCFGYIIGVLNNHCIIAWKPRLTSSSAAGECLTIACTFIIPYISCIYL